MEKINVTVTSDASFYLPNRVGGFAFQIRANGIHFKKWGPFRQHIEDSTEAELKSVANALYILKEEKLKIKVLTINVDCEFIVKYMLQKKEHKPKLQALSDQIAGYLEEIDYERLNIKHVKAHTKITNSRRWVNDWCDRHAKQGSRIATDILIKK